MDSCVCVCVCVCVCGGGGGGGGGCCCVMVIIMPIIIINKAQICDRQWYSPWRLRCVVGVVCVWGGDFGSFCAV